MFIEVDIKESLPIPITLSWQKISYTVKEKIPSNNPFASKYKKTKILQNVSGDVLPGQILSIMGPSGSGKTSLLDVITGGKGKNCHIRGSILLNGSDISEYSNIKRRVIAYVRQDEIFMETLTLKETMMFVAELKLPSHFTKQEKEVKVRRVCEELDLLNCLNTKIGGASVKGLSGGEKRRLAIGVELLGSPSVIVLDEPTSGLSSSDALGVMKSIKTLAKNNRTIILSIHQPRSEIFQMFDKLLLLSKGKSVFFGPSNQVLPYFQNLGFKCPLGWNVADFLLDLITFENKKLLLNLPKAEQTVRSSTSTFNELMVESVEFQALKSLQKSEENLEKKYGSVYAASTIKQFVQLTRRNLLNYARHPAIFWTQLFLHIFFGIVSGSVYSKITDNIIPGKDTPRSNNPGKVDYNTAVFLFWNLGMCCMMTYTAIPQFILERELFNRERLSGLYSTFAYFISKWITEIVFFSIPATVYNTIVYWWVGLSPAGYIYNSISTIVTVNVTLSSIAAIGALSPNVGVAMAFVSLINTFNLLFSGFMVTKNSFPSYWKWMYWGSYYQYAFTGIVLNQYEGGSRETINHFEIDDSVIGKWQDLFILIGILVLFRIGCYLGLAFK